MSNRVLVLGSFVADTAYRAARLPAWGETLIGESFLLGPGGKGSNQAVAAARAGAQVQMFSKLGNDAFGQLARDLWRSEGIDDSLTGISEIPTGAAAILIDSASAENAIIVVPGACFTLTPSEVEAASSAIAGARVLLAQLELPLETVARGLQIAREAGVTTILNPAPAPATLPDSILHLADFLIPNETEAAILTRLSVASYEEAEAAADDLLRRGARNVILTLGSRGSLLRTSDRVSTRIPSYHAGPVVDTTGAGDAFCGAFAAALAEGSGAAEAARFASAGAGISVTRPGTAPSMPHRQELLALLGAQA